MYRYITLYIKYKTLTKFFRHPQRVAASLSIIQLRNSGDKEQSECLARTFLWMAKGGMNGRRTVAALADEWEQTFRREGFGMYRENGPVSGSMAKPRKEELAAAVSRCRGLIWRKE